VFPGTTYAVSRRCTQREFLLRPGIQSTQIFLYALAVAAARHNVLVHVFCVLSDHYHLVVTDLDARLPAFTRYLNSLVARAMNASLGRRESFWAPPPVSAVALATPDDVIAKAAYALANPVAAGVVRHGREWPGLWSSPEQMGGETIRVRRPDAFFRKDGVMPESVELKLSPPPDFASHEEFCGRVASALARAEEDAADKLESAGRTFSGAADALAKPTTTRASSFEPRRRLNPRVAARDTPTRIAALERLKAFRIAYREALARFREGARDTVFPAGTYLMRVLHGVACAAPA
jgi:hypothetical protein